MKTNITKEESYLLNLKVCCYEHTATAETFERTIKVCGLTMEIIRMIRDYYDSDLVNYDKVRY